MKLTRAIIKQLIKELRNSLEKRGSSSIQQQKNNTNQLYQQFFKKIVMNVMLNMEEFVLGTIHNPDFSPNNFLKMFQELQKMVSNIYDKMLELLLDTDTLYAQTVKQSGQKTYNPSDSDTILDVSEGVRRQLRKLIRLILKLRQDIQSRLAGKIQKSEPRDVSQLYNLLFKLTDSFIEKVLPNMIKDPRYDKQEMIEKIRKEKDSFNKAYNIMIGRVKLKFAKGNTNFEQIAMLFQQEIMMRMMGMM